MPVEIGLEDLLSTLTHGSSRRVVVEGHRAANDGVAVGKQSVGLLLVDNRKAVVGQWIRVPDDEDEGGGGDGDEQGVRDEEADGRTWYSADVEDRGVVAGTCKGHRVGRTVGHPWEAFLLIQEEDLQSIHLRRQMPSSGDGGKTGACWVGTCCQPKRHNGPNKEPETVFCFSWSQLWRISVVSTFDCSLWKDVAGVDVAAVANVLGIVATLRFDLDQSTRALCNRNEASQFNLLRVEDSAIDFSD